MSGKRTRRKGAGTAEEESDAKLRIAIVSKDKCKPKKCGQECKRSCPVVRMGKLCIEVTPTDKIAFLSEELCIGCGICVKKCPMEAIRIINLPANLSSETTHRYGPNSFKLHRLPMPRPSEVLGLVGTNGIGKSTALKILSGKEKPNLGRYDDPPTWEEILRHFRGSELQNYFGRVLESSVKALMKPQYVDRLASVVKGQVGRLVRKKDKRGVRERMVRDLQLDHLLDREVEFLSGGELQRFAICMTVVQAADVYMFDEPSSYLDIKQRLRAAEIIREVLEQEDGKTHFVIAVEHDLSVLDYMSDFICCLYGTPGAYGVVTMPFSVREGINIFLKGHIPTENLRFRDDELSFKVSANVHAEAAQGKAEPAALAAKGGAAGRRRGNGDDKFQAEAKGGVREGRHKYPAMSITRVSPSGSRFKLNVEAGSFDDSQIVVMLGENGTGKTTFIRLLAGILHPDGPDGEPADPEAAAGGGAGGGALGGFSISYKPQKIAPKFEGTVRALFHRKINRSMSHPQFNTDVIRPLQISHIMDREVKKLSGGELQRCAIILALGKPAAVYLIDEPSAYLDSEQRIAAAKVIKRFVLNAKKTAFVVEHDFIMATYLADRVVVYSGTPGVECTAHTPQGLLTGMNRFLEMLNITFRRDAESGRPRINKLNSVKDVEQKRAGKFFFLQGD